MIVRIRECAAVTWYYLSHELSLAMNVVGSNYMKVLAFLNRRQEAHSSRSIYRVVRSVPKGSVNYLEHRFVLVSVVYGLTNLKNRLRKTLTVACIRRHHEQ